MCVGKKRGYPVSFKIVIYMCKSYRCLGYRKLWVQRLTSPDLDIKRPTLVTKGLGIDWESHLIRLIRFQIVCECNPASTDVIVK